MKKILSILIILISIVGINSVYGLSYYDSVNITAVFSEEVDPFLIDTITVSLGLPTEEEKIVELKQTENFSIDVPEIPKGNVEFLYGIVDDDRLSEYTVSGNIIKNPNNSTLDLKIVVSKTPYGEPSSKDLTEDQYNIIRGGKIKADKDYGKILVRNEDGTFSYKSKEELSTGEIESEEDGDDGLDIDLSEENSTTTTKKIQETKTPEEIKKEKEQEKINKKNNMITRILFIIIGVVILCVLLFVSVKIMNANK